MLLLGVAALPVFLFANERTDSLSVEWERQLELREVVVVARRPVLKQSPDRITYMAKNDPYVLGLNGLQVLARIPRISVTNDRVSVAGKSSVKYIVDGHLLEMPDDATALRLKNLQSSDIEKIELLTTPPSKYTAAANVAYISITTRDESFGTRGNFWGIGTIREDFSYLLGGNISHSTRKVELSADVSWRDTRGINDLDRTYSFSDYIRTSNRSNHFADRSLGANGLFKYKFSNKACVGAIANFSSMRLKSNLFDLTTDYGMRSYSRNISPARPNNSLTLTAFSDWTLDSEGKMLSLTYNFFSRQIHSFSDITTSQVESEPERIKDDGNNRYSIQSVKFDAALPFRSFRLDAGAAYTGVGNNTYLRVTNLVSTQWVDNPLQSNSFMYDEKTAAVYVSAERNFSDAFFGKLGLRYEHTDVKGRQLVGDMRNGNSYGYLFPSLNLSWNSSKAGRLSLSYSMGIVRPNFADLNPFRYYSTVNDYFSGNPMLGPAISHNAEINYGFKGIYAVIYNSYNHNAVGTITRFNPDGSQHSLPENSLDTNKTGLYASYNRALSSWWSLKIGGEVFFSIAKSRVPDFKEANDRGWSGKIEINTSWMLNRQKTLILDLRFSHYFPWKDRMAHYSSISLLGCEMRYALLGNRLNIACAVNDPFGWNIIESKSYYRDYIVSTRNDIHSHAVTFRLSWSFGRNKVANVYRDAKERESSRSH